MSSISVMSWRASSVARVRSWSRPTCARLRLCSAEQADEGEGHDGQRDHHLEQREAAALARAAPTQARLPSSRRSRSPAST